MIDEQLHALLKDINRKTQLEAMIPQWKAEHLELSSLTAQLHTAMLNEQNDVDKLEAGGIGTVIHKLTGRMEEKLDKERLEAETASNEFHASKARLQETEAKISNAEKELETLQDCRNLYIQIMQQRINQLDAQLQDPGNADQAESLKIQLQLERRRKSLREALLESEEAARAATENLDVLYLMQTAIQTEESSPATTTQEQEYLQNAEFHTQRLMEEMSDLQAKLAQMGIDPGPHISIGPYMKAPIAFLVGTASETTLSGQTLKAISQVQELQTQITEIEEKLTNALTQIEARLAQF